MNLNDAILAVTGGPTVSDGLRAWYLANGATGGTLQDMERQFLLTVWPPGDPSMSIEGLWMGFLAQSGYVLGTVQDRKRRYWTDLFTTPPPPTGAHNLIVGGTVAAYGYLDGGYGTLTPNTLSGELVYGLFVNSIGTTYLKLGVAGETQLVGVTQIEVSTPSTGGPVVVVWNATTLDYRSAGHVDLYQFFQSSVGENMVIDITPLP